jgi:hypothetical protein
MFNLLLGAFLTVFGALLIWLVVWGAITGHRSKNWPTATGTIISATVKSAGSLIYYRPIIRYSYTVQNVHYENEILTVYGRLTFGYKRAEEIVQKYLTKSSVIVHYDPRRPQLSVLEPGISISIILLAIPFIILMLFLGAVLVWPIH